MLRMHTDTIGDMFIIECEGTVVNQHAITRLYECAVSNPDAKIIVLDLSELYDVSRLALGMLASLQQWAHYRRIQLKIFNPSSALRCKLRQAKVEPGFDIAPLPEMMHLLSEADHRYSLHDDCSGLPASPQTDRFGMAA